MRSIIHICIIILITTCTLYAQKTYTLEGTVYGHELNTPVANASVVIVNTHLGAAADLNGHFKITKIPEGDYEIKSSAVGYKSIIKNVEIKSDTSIVFLLDVDALSLSEVVIQAERNYTASSSMTASAFDLALRPRETSQDLLQIVPGLIIAQHGGGGKAEQIFLRGFDNDHGTDINISIDDIPVNMVSHAHGQGYADLHYLIPETVKHLSVEKGPYFTGNGDFSTAGSVKFSTYDVLENNKVSFEIGNFDTYRGLGLVNLPLNSDRYSGYIAAEYAKTKGYFESPQDFDRYNLFLKLNYKISDKTNASFSASVFDTDWNQSGQIPERAVANGMISRFDSLDDSEGGATSRHTYNFKIVHRFNSTDYLNAQVYLFDYYFNLYSNFTFFLNNPVYGDQIQQLDDRLTYGYNLSYSFQNNFLFADSRTTVGSTLRNDDIELELWNTENRNRVSPRVSSSIGQANLSLHVQHEIEPFENLHAEFGIRQDIFRFDNSDKYDPVKTGNASETILSPKLNIAYQPFSLLKIFINTGYGFHSNDARVVIAENNNRTLPGAFGAEIGSRWMVSEKIHFTTALWMLDLENEFVYVGDEDITELSGTTRRYGLDMSLRMKLNDWLWGDADINISRGFFKDLPDDENYIPLAPDLTSSGGIYGKLSETFGVSLRYLYVGDRPANEDNSVQALGAALFDAIFNYRIGNSVLGFTVENIFNAAWNEAQFDTESRMINEAQPVSELHYTPGSPRSLKFSLSYLF